MREILFRAKRVVDVNKLNKIRDNFPNTWNWMRHKASWEHISLGAVLNNYKEYIDELIDKEDKHINERKILILGSKWTIKEQSENENKLLKNCDGYCDWTTKEIVVKREMNGTLGDMEEYIRKVVRHEIVHAFLFESGLAECSGTAESWATNETMVDWIARQAQRICNAWRDAGALDT